MHLTKCTLVIAIVFFTLPRALDPAELRGVKRAGHSQFTVAVSVLLNPQLHELLIRCLRLFIFRPNSKGQFFSIQFII
jgi:hypothetical protein